MLVASVASSKGGSGKSTTSMNLGVAMAKLGKDVTIVDTNLSTPYLSMYLGAPKVPVTLHHVLGGHANIRDAIYKHQSGAKIIPGSISMRDFEKLDLESLRDHLPNIKSDIVILDGAPGLDREAQGSIKLSDQVLIVTMPELPSVAQSLKTIRLAQNFHKPVEGVILTRAGHDLDMKIKNVETILEHKVIGTIPEDDNVKKAMVKREPVVYSFPNAPSSLAYMKLAGYLLGNHQPSGKDEIGTVSRFARWMMGMS